MRNFKIFTEARKRDFHRSEKFELFEWNAFSSIYLNFSLKINFVAGGGRVILMGKLAAAVFTDNWFLAENFTWK